MEEVQSSSNHTHRLPWYSRQTLLEKAICYRVQNSETRQCYGVHVY